MRCKSVELVALQQQVRESSERVECEGRVSGMKKEREKNKEIEREECEK